MRKACRVGMTANATKEITPRIFSALYIPCQAGRFPVFVRNAGRVENRRKEATTTDE